MHTWTPESEGTISGALFSGKVSKFSFLLRELPLGFEAGDDGGLGGRRLRFLAARGFTEAAGDRKGEDSSGMELGSTFSFGIRGGRCFEGVGVSEGDALPLLGGNGAFIEIGRRIWMGTETKNLQILRERR